MAPGISRQIAPGFAAPRGEAWQARLLTAALFAGYLPQSLLSGRSPGDTLEAVRGAVAQIFTLPG